MSIINNPAAIANPASQQPSERKVGNKELTKDDFMAVFLKQLQMQNPMKPYDSSAMLQQMSQLTSITATESLDKAVKNLNENIIQSQAVDSTQLIGKKIQTPSRIAPLVKGDGLSGSVLIPKDAANISINIKDSAGNVLHNIKEARSGSGVLDFQWDGKVGEEEMKPDFYHIEASATINGKQVALMTCGTYKVNSVAIDPRSGAILNVDGLGGVGVKDVIKII